MTAQSNPYHRMTANVCLLSTCGAVMFTVNAILIASAALVGASLAPQPVYATVPVFLLFVLNMGFAMPASLLMKWIGRRAGFQIGAAIGCLGGVISAYAISMQSFALFCLGVAMIGVHNSFGTFYRFAAADVSSEEFRSRAISYVLAGSVLAAFLGPNIANFTKSMVAGELFAGSYWAVSFLFFLEFLLVSFLKVPDLNREEEKKAGRPLREIVLRPLFLVALGSATVGYGVMNLLMTSTPLAMHELGLGFGKTAQVIQWHIVAMFAPSFFTGHLIKRFGEMNIITWGLVALVASIVASFILGGTFISFVASLVLLGLGWNFTFIGGTTLVTSTYKPSEKAKVQGFNDTFMFSIVSFTALMSGVLHHLWGWYVLCAGTLVPIFIISGFILWFRTQNKSIPSAI